MLGRLTGPVAPQQRLARPAGRQLLLASCPQQQRFQRLRRARTITAVAAPARRPADASAVSADTQASVLEQPPASEASPLVAAAAAAVQELDAAGGGSAPAGVSVADEEVASRSASSSGSSSPCEDEDEGDCPVFVDRDGNILQVMCCDYGFRSNAGRLYQEGYGQIPKSAWGLAWSNFQQEYRALRRSFREDEYGRIADAAPPQGLVGKAAFGAGAAVVKLFAAIDAWLEQRRWFSALLPEPVPAEVLDDRTGSMKGECREIRAKLKQLTLSNKAVWAREHAREAAGAGVESPWFVKGIYYALCIFLDVVYDRRPLPRFWFLETVARMPYFSYITVLHLYESLGWWRAGAALRSVHFAEEWNELHHLQIMESLGGDQLWVDRFMAQHAAIVYYVILLGLFVVSPALAYNFSELIEAHAVDTYGEFVDANEALLRSLPPPLAAVAYYKSGDLYLYDEMRTGARDPAAAREPPCETLYDVFSNIRDDEGEHVKTMAACQSGEIMADLAARREGGVRRL